MMNVKNSKTFCVLPWLMRYIHNDGHFYLCCFSANDKRNVIKDNQGVALSVHNVKDFKQLDQLIEIQEIQNKLKNSEWPSQCKFCESHEARGSLSERQSKNYEFACEIPAIENGTHVTRVLDLRLGNLCNLRCVMCGPDSSKLWINEWNKRQPKYLEMNSDELNSYKQISWPTDQSVWQKIWNERESLTSIELAGGEPLLSLEAKSFLDRLVDERLACQIHLKIVTNLTLLTEDWLVLFKKFKNITLLVSIDAIGEFQELMRPGLKWSVLETNMLQLDQIYNEFPFAVIKVNFTLQTLNARQLVPMIEWLKKFKNISPLPHISLLSFPTYMDSRILPNAMKKELVINWKSELSSFTLSDRYNKEEFHWFAENFELAEKWLLSDAPSHIPQSSWGQRLLKDRELKSGLLKLDQDLLLLLLSY